MPARFNREMRRIYFAPILALAILAGAVLWAVEAQISTAGWVEHTNQVIRSCQDAELGLRDMEVAIKSYWLSSDKRYVAKFDTADRQLTADLASIAVLVSDNPPQQQRILKVTNMEGTWIGAVQALAKQPNVGQAAVAQLEELDTRLQAASNLLGQIVDSEDELLRQRTAKQHRAEQFILFLVLLLSTVSAAGLAYVGWREIGRASKRFAEAISKEIEAGRSKDYFLATVSHELRNPLNSIILLTRVLLSDSQIDDASRQRVQAIDRAARTQAQLIDDLLDVSRIETGRLRLDVQATDLAKVVAAAVDSMRLAAEAKSITLTDIIDTNVSLIAGDPNRLEQVVWNLLSNAIKFTPKGGKVQVRLERINSHVEIVVSDNGQGIAPSSLPYVFERFWREAEGTQRNPGVGIGLSIVKELVALHGGTVIADSDGIGKGSTFTVRLPLPPATAPLLEPRRHPTVAPIGNEATAARLDGLLIMVVDDDREACEAMTELLSSLGAKLSVENSVQAALTSLDRMHPDVIVADIEMPVHDGFYFARELRKQEQERKAGEHVPLVALTAFGRVDDKVKILASGFDSHVVKPVDLAELAATIRSLVTARAA